MAQRSELQAVWGPRMLSILRIVVGGLYMMHGTQKLFGWPPSPHPGMPLMSLFGAAGIIETVGGALILLGLFTRYASFITAGEMAYAFFFVHFAHGGPIPLLNGGELAMLYCFSFLYFFAAGPGPWSLDAKLWRGRTGVV